MSDQPLKYVRGSGNVYRDFAYPDADLLQFKALVAAAVIRMLDGRELTVRQAQSMTGFAAADFSRIRNADLDRFTLDRLISIAGRLGARVELLVRQPRLRRGPPTVNTSRLRRRQQSLFPAEAARIRRLASADMP